MVPVLYKVMALIYYWILIEQKLIFALKKYLLHIILTVHSSNLGNSIYNLILVTSFTYLAKIYLLLVFSETKIIISPKFSRFLRFMSCILITCYSFKKFVFGSIFIFHCIYVLVSCNIIFMSFVLSLFLYCSSSPL